MARIDLTDQFIASLGLEAYRVGGSVRDELMSRKPKDADYMVRGVPLVRLGRMLADLVAPDWNGVTLPKAVSSLKLRTGEQIGWRVHVPKAGLVEVVLPRTEHSTGEGRHSFDITVDPELGIADDATRRDFTFNALYKLLPDGPVADPTTRGLYDLQHRLINVTHESSLADDPLRSLRALRFVSTLGFELGTWTRELMTRDAEKVTGLTQKGVSGTVLDELCKLLMGDNVAQALRDARDTGVLAHVLPELAPMIGFDQGSRYHDLTTDEHTFEALHTAAHVGAPLRVRVALLFHDAGKPASAWRGPDDRLHYYEPSDAVWKEAFEKAWTVGGIRATPIRKPRDHEVVGAELWLEAAARLNAPKSLRREVEILIRRHMVPVSGKAKSTRVNRWRVEIGDDLLRDLFLMRMCDVSGKSSGKRNLNHLEHVAALEKLRQKAQDEGVPSSVKDLPITGNDLKELGYEGPDIGRALHQLLDAVVCQPNLNNREWLLEQASKSPLAR